MSLIRVQVTSDPAKYTVDAEGSPLLTDENLFTITVNGEEVLTLASVAEAEPVLDHYTPDFWGPLIVRGNLEAAARDGVIRFEHDFLDETLTQIRHIPPKPSN